MKHDYEGLMHYFIMKGLRFFVLKRTSSKDLEDRIIQTIKNVRAKVNRCIMGMYVMQ